MTIYKNIVHCADHMDMALSCNKIQEMHDDIKDMRAELSKALSDLAVQSERFDNIKLAIGAIGTIEGGIIVALIAKALGAF